jgi:signal transduction histidine kinase
MKSIRVSLIVYFLALLVVSLGGVSLLAYRTAAQTLREKESNSQRLLDAEFQTRELDLRTDFDNALLRKAKLVVARQSRPHRVEWFNVLPILVTPAAPLGYLNLAADLRMGVPPLSPRLTPIQLRFHETRSLDQFMPAADDWVLSDDFEACQTYFRNGQIWDRTNNLALAPFTLDDQFRQKSELMQEMFDDVDHGSLALRRVTLKAPRVFIAPPIPGGPGGGPGGPGPNPPWKNYLRGPSPPNAPQTWRTMSEPYFFVQYAVETTPLNQRLTQMADEHERRLTLLGEETVNALQDLRRRLMLVCGLAIVSVLVGGLLLIWMGLAPLNRLSDAVSRINEKDFDLRIDPQSLPSELQPVAQRLRQALDQLRKAFAREKQAAQDISHDLRTPLAALSTTIEVALKKDRTGPEYREFLEDCQLSAQQMSHLVERLLALAKVDAGSNPVRSRPVDIVQVVQLAAEMVRPLARARDIAMTIHAPAELPMLADPDKLRETLTNLLHNAVDYNRDAGSIDVSIDQIPGFVEIRIADTGIGIRPEAMERLFERFYRADPSRTGDTPHCGLGLAIAKSYVDLMHGTIAVSSQPGQGTTFCIRLPFTGFPAESEGAVVAASDRAFA